MPTGIGTLLAGSAIAGAASGLIGNAASAGDRQAALDANKQGVQQWLDLNIPDPAQQQIILQKYVQTGQLDPTLETALKQDPSVMQSIQTDPALRESQLRSLDALQDVGNSGGMTITDQANLQKAINDTNAADKGRRDAIVNNMAQRGIGGSGLSLASQLDATQAATNRQNQTELDTAGQARDRALTAIMNAGTLSGNMENQQFGEASAKAQAQDAINRFNTTNMQSVADRNANRTNQAQQYNLQTKQNISNANTDLANKEEMYNKNLTQQAYEDAVQKAAGASGQYGNLANAENASAQRTANMYGGIGSAVGQAGSAYAGYKMNQDYLNKRYGSDDEEE